MLLKQLYWITSFCIAISLTHGKHVFPPDDANLKEAVRQFGGWTEAPRSSHKKEGVTSVEDLHVLLTEALSRSTVVLQNSHVFIQLGRYLYQNSSKGAVGAGEQKDGDTGNNYPFHNPNNRELSVDGRNNIKAFNPIPDQQRLSEQRPAVLRTLDGHNAWPRLYKPATNATLSRLMHPPGFRKQEGRPVSLDQKTLRSLQHVVNKYSDIHRPQDRTTWDKANFYPPEKLQDPRRKWHNKITRHDLYPPNKPQIVDDMMHILRTARITKVLDLGDKGTQIKFVVHLEDGSRAMVKPIRWSRETETLPDHYYFADHERHTAEIAAFHLDRLLNFRRCPPVTGRLINITRDIYEVGEDFVKQEFFISPAGNVCYRGSCMYYCDLHHMVCGRSELIEVSMMAFLPSQNLAERTSFEHPWRKSYSARNYAKFEDNDAYCDDVKTWPLYQEGRRMLDLMDTCVFDFLIGNTDRHHYNTFTMWNNHTAAIHVDNGKGFGNSREDEFILLLPLVQCCTIRFTTLRTLLQYHDAPVSLGQALKKSMADDMLAPVLLDPHYTAVDRRAKLILQTIAECLKTRNVASVVIDDGF